MQRGPKIIQNGDPVLSETGTLTRVNGDRKLVFFVKLSRASDIFKIVSATIGDVKKIGVASFSFLWSIQFVPKGNISMLLFELL